MEQERLRGNTRRMYVGGLDATVSSDELHRLFSAYGRIVDRIVIGNDKYTFIQFEHPGDCVRAVESRAPFMVGAKGAKLSKYQEEAFGASHPSISALPFRALFLRSSLTQLIALMDVCDYPSTRCKIC